MDFTRGDTQFIYFKHKEVATIRNIILNFKNKYLKTIDKISKTNMQLKEK